MTQHLDEFTMARQGSIDLMAKTIEIFGIKYALALFQNFAFSPVGTVLRIIQRSDGALTVEKVESQTFGKATPCAGCQQFACRSTGNCVEGCVTGVAGPLPEEGWDA